jgi:hypothetical protein
MSSPNAAPSVVVLNQQREQDVSNLDRADDAPATPCKNKTENCTVVEDGKVVVKPVEALDESDNRCD